MFLAQALPTRLVDSAGPRAFLSPDGWAQGTETGLLGYDDFP